MDEFGESLPSESVLVSNHVNNHLLSSNYNNKSLSSKKEKNDQPKPFLKKGSRKEPSALMGMTRPNSNQNYKNEESSSILETSLISNSDLLGDTTNSDIYDKWLEEQRIAKLELDEFEMIERDVDNMAVTPLLMSVDGNIDKSNLNQKLNNDSKPFIKQNNQINQEESNNQSRWTYQSADYFISNSHNSNSISSSLNNNNSRSYNNNNVNYLTPKSSINKSFQSGNRRYQEYNNYDNYNDNDHDYHNNNDNDNDYDDNYDKYSNNYNYHEKEDENYNNNNSDNDDNNNHNMNDNDNPIYNIEEDNLQFQQLDDEYEGASSVLISDTKFLRVSESQNPFYESSSIFSTKNSFQNSPKVFTNPPPIPPPPPLSNVDDSISWVNNDNNNNNDDDNNNNPK